MGALPLRSLSQLWGYLNSLVLPVWFRPFGFKLYAKIFGCNLDEMAEEDLTKYESLGEFFYRELKGGVRPIADGPMVRTRRAIPKNYRLMIGITRRWTSTTLWRDSRRTSRAGQGNHLFPDCFTRD